MTEPQSGRFRARAARPIARDSFVQPEPSLGLCVIESPNDPVPSLTIVRGRVVEMDGREAEDFDVVDRFIAAEAIELAVAEEAMSIPSLDLARMLVDIHVGREEIVRLFGGLTPAKLAEVAGHLDVLEMMMALRKMRGRRTPGNQAHVTNWKENPVLLAADAAEAALRGFDEAETTVRVAPMAAMNAMALLVGSQAGRPGVLTQCAVEEGVNLRLGFKGLTSYAETLSVYGTAGAFRDGDDTPWSKGFLASAYASRGIKIRFTSGGGSEALMGHDEGKSMLYLEARCLLMVKGAGAQGVQNGSISCIALPMALPGGVRGVLAENLLACALGLECASGNDAMASHSEMRKAAKLMLQFLPGTDFVTSGQSVIPRRDNMFGGGNFDADDLDDWLVLQRDMQVDAGLVPVREADVIAARTRAARALQAVFVHLGLPPITNIEIEAAALAHSSEDMPDRDLVADLAASTELLNGPRGVADVILALDAGGFPDVADNLLRLQRARVVGDTLQPSAVLNEEFEVLSAFTNPNDYRGPGTGFRLEGAAWERVSDLPQARRTSEMLARVADRSGFRLHEGTVARVSTDDQEIVIALGPAFAGVLGHTIGELAHREVLAALTRGVREEGLVPRFVKVRATADCGALGHEASRLSGSGIGVGVQSKGTTVIHRRGLAPLDNLELFSQAPALTLESYAAIGRNAARHAKGEPPSPVPVRVDNMARLRLIVPTLLMHKTELAEVCPDIPALEVTPDYVPV